MNVFKKVFCRIYQKCFRILIPLLPYRQPKILNDEKDIIEVLKSKKINSIFIITSKGMIQRGLIIEIIEALNINELNFTIFDKTIPNPTIELVETAFNEYTKNRCEAIIAIGGGSAIDLAKVCGAKAVRPDMPIKKMKGLLHIRKRLPLFIAIPTTAGSGSETTLAAVVTDEKTHHKYAINDFSLIPHYALLNPIFTLDLPKHLTSTTGLDALTHAVEAYIGKSTTRKTRKLSIESVKLIVGKLEECCNNPTNITARKNMLYASYYAGIAFTTSYVGYIHAIAHSIGGKYGIAHGLANAVIMPKVLEAYGKRVYKRLSILAYESKIAKENDNKELASKKFIEWIYNINEKMGIPNRLIEIQKEDIKEMSIIASKEANPLYPVPKLMDNKELEIIYNLLIE